MAVGTQKEAVVGAINLRAQAMDAPRAMFTGMFMPEVRALDKVAVDNVQGKAFYAKPRASIDDRQENKAGDWNSENYTPIELSESIRLSRRRLALGRYLGEQPSAEDMTSSTMYVRDAFANLTNKIKIGIEKLCAEAVLTGGLTNLENQSNISFGRAASLSIASANDWAGNAGDATGDIAAACDAVVAATGGAVVPNKIVLGRDALIDMLADEKINQRFDSVNIDKSVNLEMYQVDMMTGAIMHGHLTIGNYLLKVMSYPQVYQEPDETTTKFLPDNKVIICSDMVKPPLVYAGVPVISGDTIDDAPAVSSLQYSGVDFVRGEIVYQVCKDTNATSLLAVAESRIMPALTKTMANATAVITTL